MADGGISPVLETKEAAPATGNQVESENMDGMDLLLERIRRYVYH